MSTSFASVSSIGCGSPEFGDPGGGGVIPRLTLVDRERHALLVRRLNRLWSLPTTVSRESRMDALIRRIDHYESRAASALPASAASAATSKR